GGKCGPADLRGKRHRVAAFAIDDSRRPNHRPSVLQGDRSMMPFPPSPVRRSLLACLAASACLHASAYAAEPWPARPIRVVVPYAPGNTGDITLRFTQLLLEKRFGVRILIDNK